MRAAARRPGTHRLRWVTAGGFFVLLMWLAWVEGLLDNKSVAPTVFRVYSFMIFFYCLFVGAGGTADCIARERRDGTLGLLFLTNLNSAEIVAGKLCSNALALFYSLIAILPLTALLILVGGISHTLVWRTGLALADGMGFAIAAGFLASVLCVRQFPAVAMATFLSLFFGAALLGVAEAVKGLTRSSSAATIIIEIFSPLEMLIRADRPRMLADEYWASVGGVAAMSCSALALVILRLRFLWRDHPQRASGWRRLNVLRLFQRRGGVAGSTMRRRFLDINPLFWLASRQRVSAPVFMLLTVVLVSITEWVVAPFFQRHIGGGSISALAGHLVAWLIMGLLFHGLILYYAASAASQQMAEDKQSGAFELILSTPIAQRTITRGLWLAYARKMFFPVLASLLAILFFVWQGATVIIFDPPNDRIPPLHLGPWQLIWAVLQHRPLFGSREDWELAFMLKLVLLFLAGMAVLWPTLGWVGRWLGLSMRHPGFAPLLTLALAVVPPVVLFSVACYVFSHTHLNNMPERRSMPLVMWTAFNIVLGNCVALSWWAASQLRRKFRATVTSRYQPADSRTWWRRLARGEVARFAAAIFAGLLIVAMLDLISFGWQNWQSRRRWSALEKELRQRASLAAILPPAVSDAENFARSAAFQKFLRPSSSNPTFALSQRLAQKWNSVQTVSFPGAANQRLGWMDQTFTDFGSLLAGMPGAGTGKPAPKTRVASASELWTELQPLDADLAALTAASRLPFFQVSTNRDAAAVLQPAERELSALLRLQPLFHLRASVQLALGRADGAGDDVLTNLRLTELARQSPDAGSPARVQWMVVASLQPVWEGIAEHQWAEPQLAALQAKLLQFNLLADHTNALHRAVLANIEVSWRDYAKTGVVRGYPQQDVAKLEFIRFPRRIGNRLVRCRE